MSVMEISSFREWEAKHAASRSSGKAVRFDRRRLSLAVHLQLQ